MKPLDTIVLIISLLFMSGCAVSPPPQSPSEKPLLRVAVIGETGLFSADQDGRQVAFARNGLHLLDLGSGASRKLSSLTPLALAWNPDGSTLATASLSADYQTRLVLYSAEGIVLQETLLPVALSQMSWTVRGDLLVAGYELKIFSFGGNLRQMLYRIEKERTLETILADTTLKPSTTKKLTANMLSVQPVVFSPLGDELVFASLHDPPEFAPYLQLRHMNWESGAVRSLQKIPLQSLQMVWRDTPESVEVSGQTSAFSLSLWPVAEEPPDSPLARKYRFTAGRLDADALLVDWGAGAKIQLLADGHFLLFVEKVLYLGDGLQASPRQSYSAQAWTLRRWRFEDLITPDEFQKLKREGNL